MLPRAHIVHRIRSRTRLRIPDKCKDEAWFAAMQKMLDQLPGLTSVDTRPLSGSVLLMHPFVTFEDLIPELAALETFELTDEPIPAVTPMEAVMVKISRTDRLIGEASTGSIDLRTLAFLAAILLSLQQAARGNLSGPAIPMLFSALSMLSNGGGVFPVGNQSPPAGDAS
jgi:hypothetical protein